MLSPFDRLPISSPIAHRLIIIVNKHYCFRIHTLSPLSPLYFSFMLNMLLLLETNDDFGDNMLPKLSLEEVESDLSKLKLFNEALEGDKNPLLFGNRWSLVL